MSLAQRMALVAAATTLLLVAASTELAVHWTTTSRLDDLNQETEALAETWAAYLTGLTPALQPDTLRRALAEWPSLHLTTSSAAILEFDGSKLSVLTQTASTPFIPSLNDSLTAVGRVKRAWSLSGPDPTSQVAVPLGGPKSGAVLHVTVSAQSLGEQAREERRRAYLIAIVLAGILGTAFWWITSRGVGRPLARLEARMQRTEEGRADPRSGAVDFGPSEFRRLAARYGAVESALRQRERESQARGRLAALEERARGIERLTLAQQAETEFAHEIGTPLSTASGHLQLLREDLREGREPGTSLQRVEVVLEQVRRLSSAVQGKLRGREFTMAGPTPVDVAPVAERMLEFLLPAMAEWNVRGQVFQSGGDPVVAYADPNLLEQILLNLIKNAIEASPGGEIRVEAARENGTVRVIVSDNGHGIPATMRENLFTPYGSTKGGAGTGLGLVVSRRLARAMGGDLVLQPSAEGTCWLLTLPSATQNAEIET